MPPMMGHGGQLQEVLINLINAIEAMEVVDNETTKIGGENWSAGAVTLSASR